MEGGSLGLRSRTIRQYLAERGLRDGSSELERFLSARLRELTPPAGMAGRALAAERIAAAIRARESIVVFGDYDCDGMTSTAIMTEALGELGAARVTPIIASRFEGGYGLSAAALKRVMQAEPKLVITCDCGSSDHASLNELKSSGVDTVVIDHHLVPEEPLPALAFLNPHQPGCEFPYKGLASCGLSLSVVAAVRTELGRELDLRKWLDLVAIGTIADVAPLTGDNRALTRAGLAVLAETKRPGLRALLDLIGLEPAQRLNGSDVGFRIAPRLNAPGRLGSADIVVELLLAPAGARASALAAEVERLTAVRREVQEAMLESATKEAKSQASRFAVVVGQEGWNHGIVGIVAGRLADELELPTVVIGFESGVGRGSARGPGGFPLFDAIAECSPHLIRYGGHQAAAGLEISIEKLAAFREAFEAACRRRSQFERTKKSGSIRFDAGDRLSDVMDDLILLEPCGEKNPRPELRAEVTVRSSRVLKGEHLKLEVTLPSGEAVAAFGPGLGQKAPNVGTRVELGFDIRENRYRGQGGLELLLRDLVGPGVASAL